MTKRTQAILGLSGVFVLGAVCGALIFGVVMRGRAREAAGLRNRDGFVHHFERRLNLTEAQRDSLKDELERTYSRMTELREETSRRYNALIDTLAVQIMPVLTQEQRELFREQEQKFRRFLPKEKRGRRERADAVPPSAGEKLPAPAKGTPEPLMDVRKDAATLQKKDAATSLPLPAQPPVSRCGRSADSVLPKSPPGQSLTDHEKDQPSIPAGKHMEKVRQRLKLTDEQAASLGTIMATARGRIKEIKKEEAAGLVTRRRRVAEVMHGMDQEVTKLLNEEQRAEWNLMRQEMAERKKEGKKRHKHPSPPIEAQLR